MAQGRTTKILIWLLAIVIILGGLAFGLKKFVFKNCCEIKTTDKVAELDNINIGVTYLYKDLYPKSAVESSELAFNYDLFESLATFNRENILVPVLATKWDNPDNLTWRFYISPKAKFSNGEAVTAEDVKFSYDYIKANKDFPINASLPDVTAKIGDNNTIEFITKSPDPLLLNKLAWTLLVLSKKDVEANGISNNNIGTGPYILSEITDQSILLKRNENYWKDKAKIKNVTYKLVDPESKVTSLLNGTIDFISYASTNTDVANLTQAATQNLITLKKISVNSVNYLDLDSMRDKTPGIDLATNPLKNTKVRQAMAMAIDINNFTKTIPDTVASNQLVSQGMFGYNPDITRAKFNIEQAKLLMKEAGYENGFTLNIDYPQTPDAENTFKTLTENLKDINIKVTLNGLSQEQFFPKIMSRETSAYFIGFTPDTKDASEVLEGLIHTPTEIYGQYNLGYSNPAIDKIIEEAATILNQEERQQKVKQAMKMAMDDYAKLPLFQNYLDYAYSSKIYWQPRLDAMYRVYEMSGQKAK